MRNTLRIILLVAIIIFIGTGIYVFGQSRSQGQNATDGLQVSASFYPMAYFASEIGGDNASVKTITPSGVEPHDFEPTAQDIAAIQSGKLLVLNGIGFEPWYAGIANDLKQSNTQVVQAGEGLDLLEGIEEDHGAEETEENHEEVISDPHVWLSPVLAQQQVIKIRDGFIAADPANETMYVANADALTKRLQQLDTQYKDGLQTCQSKNIVTSHTAFAYLAREYGLNQVAIAGLSSSQEPSTQELAEVATFARENDVKYIFFESLVSPRLAETIANEIGAQTLVLDPLEGIPDDEIEQGKNYFTVMEDNLENLQTALVCSK
ncbi:MAG: zinc ABC transporter substrate-binding protein [Candidatus Levybacteria bacterium]|nr:zinc ABC transporter substrate-binding protein [Candidatus Levybacteria bacterium]